MTATSAPQVEVVADEIGPSLRWATAQVERTTRTDGGQGGGPAAARRVAAAPAPEPYDAGDEEPF